MSSLFSHKRYSTRIFKFLLPIKNFIYELKLLSRYLLLINILLCDVMRNLYDKMKISQKNTTSIFMKFIFLISGYFFSFFASFNDICCLYFLVLTFLKQQKLFSNYFFSINITNNFLKVLK